MADTIFATQETTNPIVSVFNPTQRQYNIGSQSSNLNDKDYWNRLLNGDTHTIVAPGGTEITITKTSLGNSSTIDESGTYNTSGGTLANSILGGDNSTGSSTLDSIGNYIDSLVTPVRDTNDTTTLVKTPIQTVADRFGITSIVTQMSGNTTLGSFANNPVGGVSSSLGSIGSTIGNSITGGAAFAGGITNAGSVAISGYVAPITQTLKNIQNIGAQFDKIIQDTFLGRVFKLKGSEILCMMLCIIISMLPCETRQSIYEAVMALRNTIKTVNSTLNEINNLSQSATEMPIIGGKTIQDSIKGLFDNGSNSSGNLTRILNVENTFMAGIQASTKTKTVNPSLIQIPDSVKNTISTIITVITVLARGQITIPVGVNGNLWDLDQAILFIIQGIVVQAADEFMTKYVNKLRALLMKLIPQKCIGNIGSIIVNKIINAINSLKEWLLNELKKLFGASLNFSIKWATFGWYNKELCDLLAMLKALSLVLANFPDLLLICGIEPCNSDPPTEIQNLINSGFKIPVTNEPASYSTSAYEPPALTPDLVDLANKFANATNLNAEDIFPGPPTNGLNKLSVVTKDPFPNAPVAIKSLINTPGVLSTLGSAYTIYNDGNSLTIVYIFEKDCTGSN